uniref:Uncharacterized protein n=1 Tax=Anopheles maculatus TaxID=74869 RepID=A0A182TAM1_9DIPT
MTFGGIWYCIVVPVLLATLCGCVVTKDDRSSNESEKTPGNVTVDLRTSNPWSVSASVNVISTQNYLTGQKEKRCGITKYSLYEIYALRSPLSITGFQRFHRSHLSALAPLVLM